MVKIKSLSKNELAFIADFLEWAGREASNNSCNDYVMPATEQNKEFMIEVISEMMGDSRDAREEIQTIEESKDEILACDWMVMKYLSKRCKNLSTK